MFQSEFAKAFEPADHVILPAVFRSSLPEDQRLSAEQLVSDLKAGGTDARFIPDIEEIVRTIQRESRSGDLVVVMSNGGFDDIHNRLLAALAARHAP